MPANHPADLDATGAEPPEPAGTGRKTRIGRRAVLIVVVAAVFVAGVVTGVVATKDSGGGDGSSSAARPSAAGSSSRPDPSADALAARTDCAPQPSACGFPDGTNTGVPAGTKLTVLQGDQEIRTPGTVLDGKDIRGCVEVLAPRVTIRNSKIACGGKGFYVISSYAERYAGGGLLIQDVTIDCRHTSSTGIGSYGLTAERVNVSGCENGFDVDKNMTVRDSFVHDPYSTAENHADGAQLTSGHGDIALTHNTIFMPKSTSAVISAPAGNTNVLISDNLFSGGAFTVYCPKDSSTNYRLTDNRFSTIAGAKGGAYGPWTYCDKVAQSSGNVWDDTLKPLAAD